MHGAFFGKGLIRKVLSLGLGFPRWRQRDHSDRRRRGRAMPFPTGALGGRTAWELGRA